MQHSAAYEVKSEFFPIGVQDIGEPNDNQFGATVISPKSQANALIGFSEDNSDWYQVTFSDSGVFRVFVENKMLGTTAAARMGRTIVYRQNGTKLEVVAKIAQTVFDDFIHNGTLRSSDEIMVEAGEIFLINVPK
ncbi:MAG: hypothetical protein ACRBF0_15165 [Calditrichia bacterium]